MRPVSSATNAIALFVLSLLITSALHWSVVTALIVFSLLLIASWLLFRGKSRRPSPEAETYNPMYVQPDEHERKSSYAWRDPADWQ